MSLWIWTNDRHALAQCTDDRVIGVRSLVAKDRKTEIAIASDNDRRRDVVHSRDQHVAGAATLNDLPINPIEVLYNAVANGLVFCCPLRRDRKRKGHRQR